MTVRQDLTESELAAIVSSRPNAARVLERHGLDFCCGGQQTLHDACRRAGIDVDAVVAELADETQGHAPDWAAMSPVALVDHIEATHHRYLVEALAHLSRLTDKVVEVHGERHPELNDIARVFAALRADLEPHLQKEEQVLHPMIRELASSVSLPAFHCGTVRNPIRVMQHEHERAGELLTVLRRATDDYTPPDDACASYQALFAGLEELERDTHLHIHKENNVLYPAVVELEQRLTVN